MTEEFESPQLENGYTRIANEILLHLSYIDVTKKQFNLLMVIFRMTYGYGRSKTIISIDRFVEDTKMVNTNVLRALKSLADMNVIIRQKTRFGVVYGFNKDFRKWSLLKRKFNNKIITNDNDIITNDNNCSQAKKDLKINTINQKTVDSQKKQQNDNNIITNDNNIITNDNNYSQVEKSKKACQINKNILNDLWKSDEKTDLYKEKDLLFTKVNNAKKPPLLTVINEKNKKSDKPKKKRTLLDSPNASQRLIGWWDKVYFDSYGFGYMHNFKKDMTIFNRLVGNCGENVARELINLFFNWTKDCDRWQYNKATLSVFASSVSQLIAEHKMKSSRLKQNLQVVKKQPANDTKEFETVNFAIMMADLQRQYGQIQAMKHIVEYKKLWTKNLQKLTFILGKIKNAKKILPQKSEIL